MYSLSRDSNSADSGRDELEASSWSVRVERGHFRGKSAFILGYFYLASEARDVGFSRFESMAFSEINMSAGQCKKLSIAIIQGKTTRLYQVNFVIMQKSSSFLWK